MIVRYLHDGDAIDHTPGSDLPAGSVVVLGDLVGVTKRPLKAGERGSLHVIGVFAFPKRIGLESNIAVGAKVYWDATNDQVTTDDAFGTYLGKAAAAATEDDATVQVRLEQ